MEKNIYDSCPKLTVKAVQKHKRKKVCQSFIQIFPVSGVAIFVFNKQFRTCPIYFEVLLLEDCLYTKAQTISVFG